MWLFPLVKWGIVALIVAVVVVISLARFGWWLRDMLPMRWVREKEPRYMSERFNRQRYQDSEEVSGE